MSVTRSPKAISRRNNAIFSAGGQANVISSAIIRTTGIAPSRAVSAAPSGVETRTHTGKAALSHNSSRLPQASKRPQCKMAT